MRVRPLGLDPGGRYLLFPAASSRPVKRYDRARELADVLGAELLSGDGIDPGQMPSLMNAANAVLVTSDNEGFGLVAVEALACDVPVFSTPVGIAPFLLRGLDGCLAAPFNPGGGPRRSGPTSRRTTPGWRDAIAPPGSPRS